MEIFGPTKKVQQKIGEIFGAFSVRNFDKRIFVNFFREEGFGWRVLNRAAANGGVRNGGVSGVSGRPSWKSAFFAVFLPFSPFSGGPGQHLENPENGGKGPFSSNILRFP